MSMKNDWNKLIELCSVYAENEEEQSEELYRKKIMRFLGYLERTYGRKVNILATRAEYAKTFKLKEKYLLEAYRLSLELNDSMNQVLVASSLSDLYFDQDVVDKCASWLLILEKNLTIHPDQQEQENLIEKKEELIKIFNIKFVR